MWRHLGVLLVAVAVSLMTASSAAACATCFGASDAAMTQGVNNAILLLLGVVGVVQGGFVALFYRFWKRSQSAGNSSQG